ncbi:hypothetical protein Palpr_2599 [Paludibacter propionicigenes WB4]|uniref:Uncharacterized protein n=1 Tax=Paludibacter propionicigenes (strain DSM 17365 / JCM 13257 / WB4) TaxID=694427 RepID=E4T7N7_PALPW|nr:hypothetical protein Palpr_2599 [Paludibacter propionicigenes WB4]
MQVFPIGMVTFANIIQKKISKCQSLKKISTMEYQGFMVGSDTRCFMPETAQHARIPD